MMTAFDGDKHPVSDVVFLIEATTHLEPYFNDLKSAYLGQILAQFNPAYNEDAENALDVCSYYLLFTVQWSSNQS